MKKMPRVTEGITLTSQYFSKKARIMIEIPINRTLSDQTRSKWSIYILPIESQ